MAEAIYPEWLTEQVPLIEAIVALLHPHVEVVVHDVKSDRIAAIWNPWAGRRVGDDSLITAEELPRETTVLGPYPKAAKNGDRITAVSALIAKGKGLLCINLDRSPLDEAELALSRFAAALKPQPSALFERDWREQIAATVDEWCRERKIAPSQLTKSERTELVDVLETRGLFETRRAAEHVAHALGISRASVYKLLKETRK